MRERRTVRQICHHRFDKPVSVSKLECPVGGRFLADRGEWCGRDLSPAKRSGTVGRVDLHFRRELQQLVEERMVKHRREFVRTDFSIAQIRSAYVAGKKGVSGKQSGGNAGFEHTETDAVRRMTGCFDHLNLHCSQDESITVFKV